MLVAEQYAAPYDLLGQALRVTPARVRSVTARWRAAGYAVTGPVGPGPAWVWLTREGMSACGFSWPARSPALSRLAHVRAVLAARLWLQAGPAWQAGNAWWRSERRVRAALPPPHVGTGHLVDAEVHWPSSPPGPHAGQVWAIEVELTPKPAGRTARIMGGLLARPGYAQVVYLVTPASRPVVTSTAERLPAAQRGRVAVRDLPASAYLPGR